MSTTGNPVPTAKPILYVQPGCEYCDAARDGLAANGVHWEERDIATRKEWRDELVDAAGEDAKTPTVVSPDGVEVGWKGQGTSVG